MGGKQRKGEMRGGEKQKKGAKRGGKERDRERERIKEAGGAKRKPGGRKLVFFAMSCTVWEREEKQRNGC